MPRSDITLDAKFLINNGAIELLVQATENIFENARAITFIPDAEKILDYTADQQLTTQLSSLQLRQNYHRRVEREVPDRVGGLLLVTDLKEWGLRIRWMLYFRCKFSLLGGVMAATGNAMVVLAFMPICHC